MKLNSLFFIIIFSILLLEKGHTQEKNIFLEFEVGVLMEKGKSNALIQKIWDKIPIDKNKEVYYEDILFNAGNLLPSKKTTFTIQAL